MTDRVFRRPIFNTALERVAERRRFIQVLAGPRQAGKTTLAQQLIEAAGMPSHYASADDPTLRDRAWLETQWDVGRLHARDAAESGALLVVDEIQKVSDWSEIVKRLWDEDTRARLPLKVMLLGSAPLLVQRGLSESLAGRFEVIRVPHWSFREMNEAFGWDLNRFLYYGGYPGAAELASDEDRWRGYVLDSLVETTLSRDVLLLNRVDKPALLRQLFKLACDYSGQILSYTKMLGQLHDAGNTTTLAHYLELLSGAGMVTGLQKYSGNRVRRRGSSPKLQVLNTALMTSTAQVSFLEAQQDETYWGRLVESAVGAHLANDRDGSGAELHYWRERNFEVDFVLSRGRRLAGIEVTAGGRHSEAGLNAFQQTFRPQRTLLVGAQGLPLEEFLTEPAATWLR